MSLLDKSQNHDLNLQNGQLSRLKKSPKLIACQCFQDF